MGNWVFVSDSERRSLKGVRQKLRERGGVYVIYGDGEPIYVGSSQNVWTRLWGNGDHAACAGLKERPIVLSGVSYKRIEWKVRPSRFYGDWATLELRLIRRLRPRLNKMLNGGMRKGVDGKKAFLRALELPAQTTLPITERRLKIRQLIVDTLRNLSAELGRTPGLDELSLALGKQWKYPSQTMQTFLCRQWDGTRAEVTRQVYHEVGLVPPVRGRRLLTKRCASPRFAP